MKKNYTLFAISALAAAMFVGCADDEMGGVSAGRFDENTIDFLTTTSRADITDLKSGFNVYATSGENPASFYITDDQYTYDATMEAWKWADNQSYAWPETTDGYPMKFYGYYPIDGTFSLTETGLDLSSNIVIPSTAQSDMMSAVGKTLVQPLGGKMTLTFNHILSRLALEIAATAGSCVHVQSIRFVGLADENSYNFTSQEWADPVTDTSVDAEYTFLSTQNTADKIVNSESDITDDEMTALDPDYDNLLVLPQILSPWNKESPVEGAYVEIIFRTTNTSDDSDHLGFTLASDYPDYATIDPDVSADSPLFIKAGVPLTTPSSDELAAGVAYNYKVNLGSIGTNNGYYLEEYYIDDEGDTTKLPIDMADIGEPVTSGYICFDVIVSTWGNIVEVTAD